MIFILILVAIIVIMLLPFFENQKMTIGAGKAVMIFGSDGSYDLPYINAFMKQPISWYDKCQLIKLIEFNKENIQYIGSIRPLIEKITTIVDLSDSSAPLFHNEYIYPNMGSGYMNPVYSYSEPLTELIATHNTLCRKHLTALLSLLKERKPASYCCMIYIPTDITELEIPSGNISYAPYGNPDMNTIYITGDTPEETQVITKDILADIYVYYSKEDLSDIDVDSKITKILGKDVNYKITFNNEYKQFRQESKNVKLLDKQLKEECKYDVPYSRQLTENDRRLPYRMVKLETQYRGAHLGQIKLFLSELEFLNKYKELSKTVLYVGAAQGMHIIYLSQLFPEHKFILYDPRSFDERLYSISNIEIHQKFFDDAEAELYKDPSVLYFCDIRTIYEDMEEMKKTKEFEIEIQNNMKQQMNWHNIMKPAMTMVKFRLPYWPGITEYLDGEVYYQAFAGSRSTELRLITNKFTTRYYDNTLYEEIAYRFNNCTRRQEFDGYQYDEKVLRDAVLEYLTQNNRLDTSSDGLDASSKVDKMIEELMQLSYGMSFAEKIKKEKILRTAITKKQLKK